MSGIDKHSPPPRAQWPYKHLWNILRGESILADDEVILEELRLSYEHIIKGLTQYAPRIETSSETNETSSGTTASSSNNKSTDVLNRTSSLVNEGNSEKKLRERISQHLDLDEPMAWELFCSFIMFEYKGGSTSFKKLLEAPRVSTEFLFDLKHYYLHERTTGLLCLQGLFGHLEDTDHKYNHIFKAFSEWADENGTSDLTGNLIKSLDCSKTEDEEIEVLHALILLTYQMPHLSIKPFCKFFKGFKAGRKGEKLLQAEAALMYTVLLLPGFDMDGFPDELTSTIEGFLVKHAPAIVLNKYSVGAVVGAWISACPQNKQVQFFLTTSPFSSAQCVPNMTILAQSYSKDSIGHRHNLPTAVLKGLYCATLAIYEKIENACPKFGSKTSYFEFLIATLQHYDIAAKFLITRPDLMDLVTDAIIMFPLELQYMLGMWGSMCATGSSSEDSLAMLQDCMKLLTTVSEYSTDPAFLFPRASWNGYRNPKNRVVAGIQVPAGSEVVFVTPEDESGTCIITWDLKAPLPVTPWSIIFEEVLVPVINQLQDGVRGSIFGEECILWTENPNGNIKSLLKFIMGYAAVSCSTLPEVHDLIEPLAYIMLRTVDFILDMNHKAILVADLIELVNASNKFEYRPWIIQYLGTVWPNPSESSSLIEDIIMGYESVANNDCRVTLAFLTSVQSFFMEDQRGAVSINPNFVYVAYNSVVFINDNVFHSFTRWRMESEEVKFKVLLNCLKVYNLVFCVDDPGWHLLKGNCVKSLLSANSSLMAALSTDEEQLQLSVIKPNRDIYLLPDIIYESLALLLKIFQFRIRSIKMVDISLGLTLVQKLGRFARHRLDYKIPTLAMSLLKKIAEEMNMSLLSCFGSDEVAFRDLILQRLEFRSEDVNLKVSILEFLTVAAHTQSGLIQYIFMDDFLAEKIVDLPTEKDEGLALSVLMFLRAMFRKGATVIKKCKSLWDNIFLPIKLLQVGGRLKIITCTLNIAAIELYQFGVSDAKFGAEVKALIKEVEFIRLMEIALSEREEQCVKCLYSIKHFISVLLHRNDLADSFTDSTKRSLLEIVSKRFWQDKEEQISVPNVSTVMAELMCQLSGSVGEVPGYLSELSRQMASHFFDDCVSVQVALLSLANECLKKATSAVTPDVVENLVRVVSRVFINCAKVFECGDITVSHPILTVGATIVCSIINSEHCSDWEKIFEHHLLTPLIVSVASLGIKMGKGPDIVIECLFVMTKLAGEPIASKMLQYSNLAEKIWTPVIRYANSDNIESTWDRVYLICVHLTTQLLQTQKYYILEECLNFWGLHGMYIVHKLWSLSEMTKHCVMNNPEHNYRMMKNLLTFNVFVLDAVEGMIPFYEEWKMQNQVEHIRVLEGVFTALQTAVNLLNQPHYLQVLISFAKNQPPHLDTRLSPQLLELQAKLWDVIYLGSHIYWKLRYHTNEFVHSDIILGTVNQVAQACVKGLTKGEKKGYPSTGQVVSSRISLTLERSLCLFHYHGELALTDRTLTSKQKQNFLREISSDIGTLCDGIKRLSGPKNDFLAALCTSLENNFKNKLEKPASSFNIIKNNRLWKLEMRKLVQREAAEREARWLYSTPPMKPIVGIGAWANTPVRYYKVVQPPAPQTSITQSHPQPSTSKAVAQARQECVIVPNVPKNATKKKNTPKSDIDLLITPRSHQSGKGDCADDDDLWPF